MTARILLVDDVLINLRVMRARLEDQYYDVLTASGGEEALQICSKEAVDLVLLDVMMVGMNGYEVCRRLKASPATRNIPVVLVTALDHPGDRMRGLAAGADDFLTKPVSNLALFARIRALSRVKLLADEMHSRLDSIAFAQARTQLSADARNSGVGGTVLVVEERLSAAERMRRMLEGEQTVRIATDAEAALTAARQGDLDLVLIDLQTEHFDPLRLCSQLRSDIGTRRLPILLVGDERDEARIEKAIDLGANDYLPTPVDVSELTVRVRTQIKRRRYDETLRRNVASHAEMAVRDPLTGLYNRRYMQSMLAEMIERARDRGTSLSVLIADIDHFKRINDGWGHEAGDHVLRQFTAFLCQSVRADDLACRYGGEEFVVLMGEADEAAAEAVAERLREAVASGLFDVGSERLVLTLSVGLAVLRPGDDEATLLSRADRGLYAAKRRGRNQVISSAA